MFKRKTNELERKSKGDRLVKRGPRFKKNCVFCKNDLDIDYKNIELLGKYVSSRGRITSRRISGNCAKHQRKVAQEIKRARYMNLIPYVGR